MEGEASPRMRSSIILIDRFKDALSGESETWQRCDELLLVLKDAWGFLRGQSANQRPSWALVAVGLQGANLLRLIEASSASSASSARRRG